MKLVTETIRAEREFGAALDCLAGEWAAARAPMPILIHGLAGGAQTAAIAELVREGQAHGRPTLLLVPDEGAGVKLARALGTVGLSPLLFPARELVFHHMTASHGTERERLFVLQRLLSGATDPVIATPFAAAQMTLSPARLSGMAATLSVGEELSPAALAARLSALGYAECEQVEGASQFARRGGIFDLYPVGESAPVRVEFFGDEIDSLSYFDPISQRRTGVCPPFTLLPAREVTVSAEARERIRAAVLSLLAKAGPDAQATLSAELSMIEGGLDLPFADKYLSVVYEEEATLFSYFTKTRGTAILLGTNAVFSALDAQLAQFGEGTKALIEEGLLSPALARYTLSAREFSRALSPFALLHLDSFGGGVRGEKSAGLFGFSCRTGVSYAYRYDLIAEDVSTLRAQGYRILFACASEGEARSVQERLSEHEIPCVQIDPSRRLCELTEAGVVYLFLSPFEGGFELPTSKIAVLSMHAEGERKTHRPHRVRKKGAGERLLSYAELREGDYVVHAVHGIGVFGGMTTITQDGVSRDYITIRYAGTDKLFLPADRLEMISKYIGTGEDGHVKVSKLGGAEWTRTKSRAKAAAKDMAKKLISLYAARMRRPGHAFAPEDDLTRAFENAFPYEETEAQLAAWDEIRSDMEKATPMDRLLCGDVGYGKTEVALRAAFKAVADGKQVAILVPTTVLAMQHFETASARMRGFPVTVEMLSRVKTQKEQEKIMRRVARGEVDILIGTHKLLSSKIAFRDLGLLIVDEEQRFGVAQKEKLKEMAGNVDVLTLTATPIPRTLNMAMSGIRDMSLLDEAPADRLPVETYICEHNDALITEAIRRELRRGGQVIYLYNRTETMERVAHDLSSRLPDARIIVAHGKMEREELEDSWASLVRGEVDIIICTTIVETGVDLPRANTLIVEDADRLGLSQLHQLRGRVGRSGRQAYAYFTFRRGKSLSEIATKRLSAIREYAAFGAGFQIALRDLEIRGAGNLLGAEQHGNIEAVGYELYVRLLSEALIEEKGEDAPPPTETVIELATDAHIPERYIARAPSRMEMYKKISAIATVDDAKDIYEEFCDRFGRPPRAVENLLCVSLARALGARYGFLRVCMRGGAIAFLPRELDLAPWSLLFAEIPQLKFAKSAPPCVLYTPEKGVESARAAAALLVRYGRALSDENGKGETK